MNSFLTLLKREYWEHKTGMFWAPVIAGGLIVFGVLLSVFVLSNGKISINGFGEHDLTNLFKSFDTFVEPGVKALSVQMANYTYVFTFTFVMAIVAFFYGLGSLYDDRKDKSILFWKSLPVSDTNTVLSKVVTVMVVMPLMYWAVMQVTMLLVMVLASIFAWVSDASAWESIWGPSNYFVISFYQLVATFTAFIWMAPLIGFIFLVSSWTKKVPFLVATVPVLMIGMVEGIVFNTSHLVGYIAERFIGVVQIMWAPAKRIIEANQGAISDQSVSFIEGGLHNIRDLSVLDTIMGLVIGAGFIIGAIMIRRYRDEAL